MPLKVIKLKRLWISETLKNFRNRIFLALIKRHRNIISVPQKSFTPTLDKEPKKGTTFLCDSRKATTRFELVIRVLQTIVKSAASPYFISISTSFPLVWFTIGTLSLPII